MSVKFGFKRIERADGSSNIAATIVDFGSCDFSGRLVPEFAGSLKPLALEVLHTPGHSPGSLSLHMPGAQGRIFSGDTLFQNSIGRTDLWGGSSQEILRSIASKLLSFADEMPVFPGHGEPTTIGEEREHNPFLRGL